MVVPPGLYMVQDKSFSSFDPRIVTKIPFVPSLDKPPLIDSLIVNFSGNNPKTQHSNVNEDKEPKIPQDKHEQYFGESNTTHLHSLGFFRNRPPDIINHYQWRVFRNRPPSFTSYYAFDMLHGFVVSTLYS